jgi:hypothetical protein
MLLRIVPVFLAAALAALSQTAVPNTPTTQSTLPPFGLAMSETAQVNIVATTVVTPVATSATAAAPSCSGTVTFYNAKGAVIGTATPFSVASGQISSITLPGSSGPRAVIRAVITNSTPITVLGLPPCDLAYSLETYDTTSGVTHFFVSGVLAPAIGPIRVGVAPTAP